MTPQNNEYGKKGNGVMDRAISPLRYPGGKTLIYPFLESFFKENGLVGSTYAEPFAGGAGLALSLLYNGIVKKIYINDFDTAIYSFWNYALNQSDDLCEWIADVPINISTWKEYHNACQNCEGLSIEELAKAVFFLNRTNVSGVIKGGVIGGIEQKGTYKIDARFNRKALIKRILKLKEFKDKIVLSREDALCFLRKREKMKTDIFIYLDPPYYQKAPNLYLNFYREADHRKLSEFVLNMKKKWMVSYDNHPFIQGLYSEKTRMLYSLQQSTSNRVGKEIIVFKDGLKFDNSMQYLKNAEIL